MANIPLLYASNIYGGKEKSPSERPLSLGDLLDPCGQLFIDMWTL